VRELLKRLYGPDLLRAMKDDRILQAIFAAAPDPAETLLATIAQRWLRGQRRSRRTTVLAASDTPRQTSRTSSSRFSDPRPARHS
jgi:hypothetical protein